MRDLGQILIEQGIGEQFREALEGTAPTTLPAIEPVPAFAGNREQRRAAARGKPVAGTGRLPSRTMGCGNSRQKITGRLS